MNLCLSLTMLYGSRRAVCSTINNLLMFQPYKCRDETSNDH